MLFYNLFQRKSHPKMNNDGKILNVEFNHDQGLFACCMETGVNVYNVEPLVLKSRTGSEEVGSVSICEIINRSNLLALVGGGSHPKVSDNVLLIFNDTTKSVILEITFPTSIRAVRIRRDKLVVVLSSQIHVFSFPSPTQKLFTLETKENKLGLCEVTPIASAERQVLIFPGLKIGSVQVIDLTSTEVGVSTAPVWISAHKSELGCLALNQQGTRIATASNKGTLIRVWDTSSKAQLVELRRGSDPATVYCINFSRDSEYLCCSSDKGTIHIFAIKNPNLNKRALLQNVRILGKYVESMWALATFTVPPECACICSFGSYKSVYAICMDGTFHKYSFTLDGSCNKDSYDAFLNVSDEDISLV